MKNYKLLDTEQNRVQYDLFLNQYNQIKSLENKTSNQEVFLFENEYRLKAVWIQPIEEAIIVEDELEVKELSEVEKAVKKVVEDKTTKKRIYKKRTSKKK